MNIQRKPRLAILVNIVAPYRLPIYEFLNSYFDVKVFCGKREGNRPWKLSPSQKIQVKEVCGWVIPLTAGSAAGQMRDIHYLHINPGLFLELMRFKPDVVVTNEMGFRTASALLYGAFTRVPVWIWWGGTNHSERNVSRLTQFVRRHIVRRAKHWISYGQEATKYLESLGVIRASVLQIQNCVEQEKYLEVPESYSGLLDGLQRPILLCVGQLIERKGCVPLLESCARLVKEGYNFSLALVGSGPQKEALQMLATTLGLDNVVILPDQPGRVVNQLYHEADIFVFPTLEDIWGLVVNEALWAGLPVVCSRYAGSASELLPAECIFDPLVPDSIDTALRAALTHPVHRQDTAKLLTWQEVARDIGVSLIASIKSPFERDGNRGAHV